MPALLAFFGWGKFVGQAIVGWLSRRSLSEICALGLAFLCLTLFVAHRIDRREIRKLQAQITACSSARHADQEGYRKAQSDAQAKNTAQVQKIEQLQEKVNEASRSSFIADRDRLRAQSGADKGSAGTAAVPQVPHAAPGTPPEVVSLPPAELLRAQETELQLNALIDWINDQSKADQNAR